MKSNSFIDIAWDEWYRRYVLGKFKCKECGHWFPHIHRSERRTGDEWFGLSVEDWKKCLEGQDMSDRVKKLGAYVLRWMETGEAWDSCGTIHDFLRYLKHVDQEFYLSVTNGVDVRYPREINRPVEKSCAPPLATGGRYSPPTKEEVDKAIKK